MQEVGCPVGVLLYYPVKPKSEIREVADKYHTAMRPSAALFATCNKMVVNCLVKCHW
jgi:hypothetical protein